MSNNSIDNLRAVDSPLRPRVARRRPLESPYDPSASYFIVLKQVLAHFGVDGENLHL